METRADARWARPVVGGTLALRAGRRLAVAARGPRCRPNGEAHNFAVEQAAGSRSLAAAAHRERWADRRHR